MTRRVIVERRSLTRRDPEQHLLDAEQHAAWRESLAAERCPLRDALTKALNDYAARYGWPEAAGWCAARAQTGLGPMAPVKRRGSKAARKAAEAVFAGVGA